MDPYQSARIIVNHVVDGAAIARQHKMPKPVIDGILMHHGTGRVEYFYAKAVEQAGDSSAVDEQPFRYPGIRPDSREMGIMLLADKVEAACRTLKDKSAENIRALIQKLVNSAVTDGQLVDCPLTVRELYQIVEAFTQTLLGIYHHRIDYPGIPVRTGAVPDLKHDETTGPIITLEMQNPLAAAAQAEAEATTTTPTASEDLP
jgi:membrane-associated HD superfamily phosphohydrolase